MGLFDFLTGNADPDPAIAAVRAPSCAGASWLCTIRRAAGRCARPATTVAPSSSPRRRDGALAWGAGIGGLHFQAQAFRGQSRYVGKSWDIGGAKVGTASFDTDEIKRPLRETVAVAGWGWHGVTFARL